MTSPIGVLRALLWYKPTYVTFYLGLGACTGEAAVVEPSVGCGERVRLDYLLRTTLETIFKVDISIHNSILDIFGTSN